MVIIFTEKEPHHSSVIIVLATKSLDKSTGKEVILGTLLKNP